MAARQATARLTRLERLEYGTRYRFDMEPNAQVEKILLEWAHNRTYVVQIEYNAVIAGKKTYTITAEGMWILSHLFSNWEEMTTDAETKYYDPRDGCGQCGKPCDPGVQHLCVVCGQRLCDECRLTHYASVHATRNEQDPPREKCSHCGKYGDNPTFTSCPHCSKRFCDECWLTHIHIVYERTKAEPPPKQSNGAYCQRCGHNTGPIVQCKICKKHFCASCSYRHTVETLTDDTHAEPKQEEQFTGRRCSSCYGREFSGETFRMCPHCGKYFCDLCYAKHALESQPGYERFFRNYFSDWQWDATRTGQQQQSSTSSSTKGTSSTQTRSIPVLVQQALSVLGVSVVNANEKAINTAYRKKAKSIHPDIGGKEQEMVKLNLARDAALKWVKDNSRG